MSLDAVLSERRICICVGAGGVGKTTSAAAIALGLAAKGQRVALRGEVWAMVLDPKRTFDDLIRRLAVDEATRDRVFSNRIYREISGAVGGSHEFTAVAKLFELDRSGQFDAIVLDTPPSRNTLDFLRAPEHLMQFFDAPALRLFLAPAGLGARFANRAGAPAMALMRRLIGIDLLGEIALFFAAVGSLVGGFRERAAAVEALLRDRGTTFVLISSPEREPVRESIAFAAQLRRADLEIGGVLVNRVAMSTDDDAPSDSPATELALVAALGERLGGIVAASAERAVRQAHQDQLGVARLRGQLDGVPLTLVPRLDRSLGELETLGAVARRLFD